MKKTLVSLGILIAFAFSTHASFAVCQCQHVKHHRHHHMAMKKHHYHYRKAHHRGCPCATGAACPIAKPCSCGCHRMPYSNPCPACPCSMPCCD